MKKVFIGVLCALMLFGFVACDNNTPSGMVYSIEATQTSVFVEGEQPTADGFTYSGYTNMGTTVTIDPSEITLGPINGNSCAIIYKGVTLGEVEVDLEPVESISVDASGAVTSYYARLAGYSYEEAADVDTTGLVVTAAYDGGTKVVDVENLGKNLSVTSNVTDWEDDGDYTVTVKLGAGEDTYDITIVPNLVTSVNARATEDYTVYYDGKEATGADVPDYLTATEVESETAGYWMEKTYQGGEVVVVDVTDVDFAQTNGSFGNSFDTSRIPSEGGSLTVTLKYTGTDGTTSLTGSSRNSSVSISWAKKEAVSVEVTEVPSELSHSSTFSSGTTGLFAFEVTYNDGTTASASAAWWTGEGDTPDGNYIILQQREAIKDYTVGDRYTFSVTGRVAGLSFEQSFEAVVK